ncbi:MAG: hypothetical protein C4522_18865 [Desulfobacteraceae bacterium]|nr:MAG: hypothetical protein C4522_18865 [Desulfobacteraceae bacterium]
MPDNGTSIKKNVLYQLIMRNIPCDPKGKKCFGDFTAEKEKNDRKSVDILSGFINLFSVRLCC